MTELCRARVFSLCLCRAASTTGARLPISIAFVLLEKLDLVGFQAAVRSHGGLSTDSVSCRLQPRADEVLAGWLAGTD